MISRFIEPELYTLPQLPVAHGTPLFVIDTDQGMSVNGMVLRRPAPPASEAGKGRQRQGARCAIVLRQKWSRGQVELSGIVRPAPACLFCAGGTAPG